MQDKVAAMSDRTPMPRVGRRNEAAKLMIDSTQWRWPSAWNGKVDRAQVALEASIGPAPPPCSVALSSVVVGGAEAGSPPCSVAAASVAGGRAEAGSPRCIAACSAASPSVAIVSPRSVAPACSVASPSAAIVGAVASVPVQMLDSKSLEPNLTSPVDGTSYVAVLCSSARPYVRALWNERCV